METLKLKTNNLSEQLKVSKENYNLFSFEKKSLKNKLNYTQSMLTRETNKMADRDTLETLDKEVEKLNTKIISLNDENKDLNDLISLLQNDEIVTFQNGKYCNEIREVIMELCTTCNVSMTKQQQSKMLPALLADPSILIGRKIRHKIQETSDDEYCWCLAEVIAVSKEAPNRKRTLYDVTYEENPNELFGFPLIAEFV